MIVAEPRNADTPALPIFSLRPSLWAQTDRYLNFL
jgi:hypothetical protein